MNYLFNLFGPRTAEALQEHIPPPPIIPSTAPAWLITSAAESALEYITINFQRRARISGAAYDPAYQPFDESEYVVVHQPAKVKAPELAVEALTYQRYGIEIAIEFCAAVFTAGFATSTIESDSHITQALLLVVICGLAFGLQRVTKLHHVLAAFSASAVVGSFVYLLWNFEGVLEYLWNFFRTPAPIVTPRTETLVSGI